MTDRTDATPARATNLVISRRHLVIGAVVGGASLAAQAALPKVEAAPIDKKAFAKWIPTRFDGWSSTNSDGIVMPPPDVLSDRLYDDLVSMTYVDANNAAVMVVVAYNYRQDGIVQLHRPEICYPTGGYKLSPAEALSLDVANGREVPANFFTASSSQRIEQVLYWTRIGRSFPRTWIDQRASVIASNLRGSVPDGVLVRFSVIGANEDESLAQLRAFVPKFVAASPKPLQRVMIGAA